MKKTTIWAIIVVVVIAMAGFVVWYYNKPQEQINMDKTVKIGVIVPLTGFSQENGQNVKKGIDLAFDKIKKENPNLDIELFYEDDKCDAKEGLNAYNNLVKIKGVKMIIGTVCSAVTLAIAPVAEKDQIVYISSQSSSPTITNAGDYIFRVYPSDNLDAILLADFAKQKGSKVAVVSINNDYGLSILKILQNKLGNNLVVNEKFNYGADDFRSILTKIKFAQADAIVFVAYPDNTMNFLRQAKELNLKQTIIGSSATITNTLFEEIYNNFYFTNPNAAKNSSGEFINAYQTKYSINPPYGTDYGYDSLLTLFKAWQNSKNIGLLKDVLYETSINGATGKVSFDANGDRLGVTLGVYDIPESKQLTCISNCD